MHGLMAVAIAIVAPLALLASIHGLVMHVWAGGGVTAHNRTPDVEHDPVDSAPHAHPQVSAPTEPHPQHNNAQDDADTSPLSLTDLDAQITDSDLDLARLVCSRGRNDDRVVARVLVAERLRVHREQTADLTACTEPRSAVGATSRPSAPPTRRRAASVCTQRISPHSPTPTEHARQSSREYAVNT